MSAPPAQRASSTRGRNAAPTSRHGPGTPRPMPTASSTPTGWCGMTDADADMVLGVVRVAAWRHSRRGRAPLPARATARKGPGHEHIHGANMGFRADAYWQRRRLPRAAHRRGRRTRRAVRGRGLARPPRRRLSVATSDAQEGRAPGGFAQHLRDLSRAPGARTARAGMTPEWSGTGCPAGTLDLPFPGPARPRGAGSGSPRWPRSTWSPAGSPKRTSTPSAILAELGGPPPTRISCGGCGRPSRATRCSHVTTTGTRSSSTAPRRGAREPGCARMRW